MSDAIETPSPACSPIISGLQRQGYDESRGLRPEGTKDWLLVTTLSGVGYVRVDDRLETLHRGDMLLIAPNTPQEYGHLDEESRWVNIWVHFRPRPHWMNWLAWPQIAEGVMVLATGDRFDEVETELRRLVDVASGPLRLRLDASMNSLERVLIAVDDINPLHRTSQLDTRIKKALEIIGERLAEPLTIEELGREVGLSRSWFTVLFTEQMNISPQSYIEAARLSRAAQMLTSSTWPITLIAEDVGFPNAFYFSTRFRRQFGLPPSLYRQRFGHHPPGRALTG